MSATTSVPPEAALQAPHAGVAPANRAFDTGVPVGDTDIGAAERARLSALRRLEILGTPADVIVDELVRIAAALCQVPIAAIGFIDKERQWFKARTGLRVSEIAREIALCDHTIRGTEPFVVADTQRDPRFVNNPLVTGDPGIRFYAGVPLITRTGHAVGALCLIDRTPRLLGAKHLTALKLLASHTMAHLELRHHIKRLTAANAELPQGERGFQDAQSHLKAVIQQQEARILELAQFSPQTGLANRTLFLNRLEALLSALPVISAPVAVLVFELERFHLISSTLGDESADQLLKQVAARLVQATGDAKDAAHLGLNQFAVAIRAIEAKEHLGDHVTRLLAALSGLYRLSHDEVQITFKAGAALALVDGRDPATVLRCAKSALVSARTSAESYALFSAGHDIETARALSLEARLRRAVEADQFLLHYQPKVSLKSGRVTGVEALLRWRDPQAMRGYPDGTDGLIAPARFIPLLEETGLIVEVGQLVLRQAMADLKRWRQRGLRPPRVAVNISPVQLQDKHVLRDFAAILKPAEGVCDVDFEITEALLMRDAQTCITRLRTLQEWGIRIAIDDFGTGYSSLGYLSRLPINALKIDRTFVQRMTENPNDMSIVSAVISLAHGIGLDTIAEGVESAMQENLLRLLRCDEMQGFLVSKPVPEAQLTEYLLVNSEASMVAAIPGMQEHA